MARKRARRASKSKGRRRSSRGHKTTFKSKSGNRWKLVKVASGIKTGRSKRARRGRKARSRARRRR